MASGYPVPYFLVILPLFLVSLVSGKPVLSATNYPHVIGSFFLHFGLTRKQIRLQLSPIEIATILDKIKWNSKPSSSPNQEWSRAKGKNAPFSHPWFGRGEGGLGFPFILSKIVDTVWHEIFAGVYYCGLAIFCVLRELILGIRTDWFFKRGINFCDFQKVPSTQH